MFVLKSITLAFTVSQGGDTLTLALGIMPSSNSQPSPMAASSPAAAAPVPQPDASPKLINLDSPNSNSDPTPPISVTHFSPAVNGNGVQKETIFSNTNPFLQNGEGESAVSSSSGDSKNPFAATNGSTGGGGGGGKYATIGRTNPFTKNSNPFLDTLTNANTADGGGGGGESSHVTENTSSSSSNDTSMEPVASTTPVAEAAAKKTLNKIVSDFISCSLFRGSDALAGRQEGPIMQVFLTSLFFLCAMRGESLYAEWGIFSTNFCHNHP